MATKNQGVREKDASAWLGISNDIKIVPLVPKLIAEGDELIVSSNESFGVALCAPRWNVVVNPSELQTFGLVTDELNDDVLVLKFGTRSLAAARQWSLALRRSQQLANNVNTRQNGAVRRPVSVISPHHAQLLHYNAHEPASMSGWLEKRGRRRFFRLIGERLLWFDDSRESTEPHGSVLVSLCSIVALDKLTLLLERGAEVGSCLN